MRLLTPLIIFFLLFRAGSDPSDYLGCHIGCEVLLYSYGVHYPDFRAAGELPYGINYGDVWVGVCQSSCLGYLGGDEYTAVQDKELRTVLGRE